MVTKVYKPEISFYLSNQKVSSFNYTIANHSRWKSFAVFVDRSVPRNFSNEIAFAVGLSHARPPSNHESFPVNKNLVLQLRNFSTSNDLQYTVLS